MVIKQSWVVIVNDHGVLMSGDIDDEMVVTMLSGDGI